MQHFPQKNLPRHRDWQDAFEEQGGRQAFRAAPRRAPKFHQRDEDAPRAAQRKERGPR
jgi:hypothetical protein